MDYCKSYLTKGNSVPKNFIDLIYALDEEEFAAYIQELKKEKRKSRNAKYYYKMVDYLKKALIYGHTRRISS